MQIFDYASVNVKWFSSFITVGLVLLSPVC